MFVSVVIFSADVFSTMYQDDLCFQQCGVKIVEFGFDLSESPQIQRFRRNFDFEKDAMCILYCNFQQKTKSETNTSVPKSNSVTRFENNGFGFLRCYFFSPIFAVWSVVIIFFRNLNFSGPFFFAAKKQT